MNYNTTYRKDCPWCGQRPELELTPGYYHYTLRCINEHCAAGPEVMGRTFDDVVEKWNDRAEEAKNTKVITQINSTDVEVVDTAEGSRRIYRFNDGYWWLIDSSCKPHMDHGGTK